MQEDDYVEGALEDWTHGAQRQNGRDQYAVLPAVAGGGELDVGRSSFLVEAVFRTDPQGGAGILVHKLADAGFALRVSETGVPQFVNRGPGSATRLDGKTRVNDGAWHHVIAEADRSGETLRLYVDGKLDAEGRGLGAGVSLGNLATLHVGGCPDGDCLAGALDFMRIALGTLADSKTTIEELYAWQFDGPFLRDWNGREAVSGRRAAGAIDLVE